MIKRICDCCGAELKKEFVQFHIKWNMVDAVSGEVTSNDHNTPYLEYCKVCFSKALGKIRIR